MTSWWGLPSPGNQKAKGNRGMIGIITMLRKLVMRVYSHADRRTAEPELRVRQGGFDIVRAGKAADAIDFGTIKEISAFKRDLGTTDLVCFEIMVIRGAESLLYEVNEEMRGFDELVRSFEQLPMFVADWRELVIQPAFLPQRTTIFRTSARR